MGANAKAALWPGISDVSSMIESDLMWGKYLIVHLVITKDFAKKLEAIEET